MPPDVSQLDILVATIVRTVHPLRVILFGSAARGQATAASDIDLLIVMPDGAHRRQTAQLLYRTIHGIRTPFDLVVATAGDLETHRDNVGLIYRTALREGKTLYAA